MLTTKQPPVAAGSQGDLIGVTHRRPVDVAVGDMMAQLRAVDGRSLAALSRETGLTKSTLVKIERGTERPAPEHLLAIAQALGVSVARFFEHLA